VNWEEPGWQYWNKDPKFGELVHQNTREMIRRDRNHPSVLMRVRHRHP